MKFSLKNLAGGLLLSSLLLTGCSQAATDAQPAATEPLTDPVVVVVNGEQIRQSVYLPYREQYFSMMYDALSSGDPSTESYVEDLAMTACIQDTLIQQDIHAQNCDVIPDEEAKWLEESGTAAYEQALIDMGEYLRVLLEAEPNADMTAAAKTYAANSGISAQTYIEVYREQYIAAQYYSWLMQDHPVTDEDVTAAYESRIASGKELYENDVQAFETDITAGKEVWYRPSGYRSFLQILLPCTGDTDEEKLASAQNTIDDIYARLEAGEAFESLITEYGTDSSFADPEFLKTGYTIHPDSILWDSSIVEAAFDKEMSSPGTWSRHPVVSSNGIHILYYLADAESGPAALTEQIREALSQTLYSEMLAERLNARLNELSAAASVVYPEAEK